LVPVKVPQSTPSGNGVLLLPPALQGELFAELFHEGDDAVFQAAFDGCFCQGSD